MELQKRTAVVSVLVTFLLAKFHLHASQLLFLLLDLLSQMGILIFQEVQLVQQVVHLTQMLLL